MDHRGHRLPFLGICCGLLNYIMAGLSALAFKPLALASPVYRVFAICQELYRLILQSLAEQAVKPVTLGLPMHNPPARQNGSGLDVPPTAHGLPQEGASNHAGITERSGPENERGEDAGEITPDQGTGREEDGKVSEEALTAATPTVAPQTRAPKKMVSINETVEEIYPSKNKKRKKSSEKLPSMSREKDEQRKPLKSILKMTSNIEDEQQKPLKSILKMPSNVEDEQQKPLKSILKMPSNVEGQ